MTILILGLATAGCMGSEDPVPIQLESDRVVRRGLGSPPPEQPHFQVLWNGSQEPFLAGEERLDLEFEGVEGSLTLTYYPDPFLRYWFRLADSCTIRATSGIEGRGTISGSVEPGERVAFVLGGSGCAAQLALQHPE